jgi:hypothetical protein
MQRAKQETGIFTGRFCACFHGISTSIHHNRAAGAGGLRLCIRLRPRNPASASTFPVTLKSTSKSRSVAIPLADTESRRNLPRSRLISIEKLGPDHPRLRGNDLHHGAPLHPGRWNGGEGLKSKLQVRLPTQSSDTSTKSLWTRLPSKSIHEQQIRCCHVHPCCSASSSHHQGLRRTCTA